MITRIRIKGYKSLRDVELSGLTRLVLLFGPNSAGKSNLLDALDLLGHIAREDTLIEAFRRHRGNRLERPLPVRWFFHHRDMLEPTDATMEFEVDFRLQRKIVTQLNSQLAAREGHAELARPYTRVTRDYLRYRLSIRYQAASRALEVVRETLGPLKKSGEPNEAITPYIRHDPDLQRLSVKLERQSHPRYYDMPRTRSLLSEIGDAVNHPHIIATALEFKSTRIYYVEPTRMRTAVNDVEATDPGPHGEQLASFYHWLRRQHRVRFKNLVHNLARIVPTVKDLSVREGSEGFLELWVEEVGKGEFPAALISEGTLRLLCLLGIAATPQAPAMVGYEEPENGVNPGRLAELLSALESAASGASDTQFFVTTHSPKVIDFFTDALKVWCTQVDGSSRYQTYDELPLFHRLEIGQKLGDVPGFRERLGEQVARGDLG